MSIDDCTLLDLPRIIDHRGNLTFLEEPLVPFEIKRVYFLYDVPSGAERGGHAHLELEQLIIPLSGSFDVTLDDGETRKRIPLNRPYVGLYVKTMVWRELDNFSSGSVCLVLASTRYEEADYIRDYEDFLSRAAHARSLS
jgi:hypothetical protein